MFTDLRGFTAMSEGSTEAEILEALDGYFEVVVQAVEEHGGDVLKFMGDGILSIFTIAEPGQRASGCRRAAQAAGSALTGLAALNEVRGAAGKPSLDIGAGINVGAVSYGNIGSPGRLDFTVLGSTVNVASRIEGLTKVIGDRVLATAAVAAAAPELFVERGRHHVRGVEDPIPLFGLVEAPADE